MSKNSNTILITGATGTVGSEVLKQLSSATPTVKIKAAVHSIDNANTSLDLYSCCRGTCYANVAWNHAIPAKRVGTNTTTKETFRSLICPSIINQESCNC
jgi:hypothetical protein